MASLDVATLEALVRRIGPGVVDVVGVDPDALESVTVSAITHDSRQVVAGSMFACLPGATSDGHDFAPQAIAGGATSLLVDRRLADSAGGTVPQIVVDDARRRLGPVSAEVAGNPSRTLLTVGVTGTNGKTTVTSMLASIFETASMPTGVIGTLSGPRTTPEAPDLQRTLADFVTAEKRAAVLEVSSHALSLHRVDGTEFDAVVFTNLGQDHLDLHGTPEAYFRAKATLFDSAFAPVGIINVDDTHGRLLADAAADATFDVIEFSVDDLTDVVVEASTITYRWNGHDVYVNMGGHFNVSNSLAALVTATHLGIPVDAALAGLRNLVPVPGRFEVVSLDDGSSSRNDAPVVVVDYAHTPDGLAEAIASARQVAPDAGRVVAVFGCGGDRDHAKRPIMGACASRLADRVIVTSDNPRTEDPQRIIDDVLAGVDANYRSRVTSHVDRRSAIHEAIASASKDDIVLIAGKGHESYQQIGSEIVDFDDRLIARDALRTFAERGDAS